MHTHKKVKVTSPAALILKCSIEKERQWSLEVLCTNALIKVGRYTKLRLCTKTACGIMGIVLLMGEGTK